MKITEHIAKAKKQTQFTFEILPPLKGQNINSLFEAIDLLMDFNPPFIDANDKKIINTKLNLLKKSPKTMGDLTANKEQASSDKAVATNKSKTDKSKTENNH